MKPRTVHSHHHSPTRNHPSSSTPSSSEYFLAGLCDLRVEPEERQKLGSRYPYSPEVRRLLSRISEEKPVSVTAFAPNALLSALKEILASLPGGIFMAVSDEFYQISIDSPFNITVVYLHGLLETLPWYVRQLVYLLCRSLRNVVGQCAGSAEGNYTDLLLSFTPVLFPSSVGHLPHFLRAARLTLVMVDCFPHVFKPFVWLDDTHNNPWRPLGDDEAFLYQILGRLQRLESSLEEMEEEEEEEEETEELPPTLTPPLANKAFYQVVYFDTNSER